MKPANKLFSILLVIGLVQGCTVTSKPDISEEQLQRASELNAELGVRYLQQGPEYYERALMKLEKAIEQNEDNARAHHYLGEMYRRVNKPKEADKHFKQALNLTPDEPALLNNYGVFLCDRKQYDAAQGYFKQALDNPVYPGKDGVYENMGMCALNKGDIHAAEKYLLQALRLNPRLLQAQLAMAQISFDRGLFDQSRKYLYDYLERAKHNSQTLWLGILLERRTGNRNRVASYAILLKGKFPDSKEAKMLRKLEAQGKL